MEIWIHRMSWRTEQVDILLLRWSLLSVGSCMFVTKIIAMYSLRHRLHTLTISYLSHIPSVGW